jgi:hypothetical protein
MENSFNSSTSRPRSTTDGHPLGPRVSSLAGFQGRIEEAHEIVARMHAGGDRISPLVEFEIEEMARSIQLERELKASTGWRDMISTEDNRKRLFISIALGVFAQWNGVGLVSASLATTSPQSLSGRRHQCYSHHSYQRLPADLDPLLCCLRCADG